MQMETVAAPFRLNGALKGRLPTPLSGFVEPLLEKLLALRTLEEAYHRLPSPLDAPAFAGHALETLGARFLMEESERLRIPVEGPVLIVANHPIGGLEGIYLISLLGALRRDFRVLGNEWLSRIPEIANCIIPVSLFGGRRAVSANARALRTALRCLRQGEAVVTFPAGEVSHLRPSAGGVIDPPWSEGVARLARLSRVPVLPVHFDAANSLPFQVAGLVHPSLRTAFLPREMLNKRRVTIRVGIGCLLQSSELRRIADDSVMTRHLRLVTYSLSCRGAVATGNPGASPAGVGEAIVAADPPERLAREVDALGPGGELAAQGALSVHLAGPARIPRILREIGRLRESTFRQVGEGTGNCIDLDEFDERYEHLFVWDRNARQVVGSYRIGRVDGIVRSHGVSGLYTRTLFHFGRPLPERMGHALEVGRSFVRPEYQRSYVPLLLLWKGIGAVIAREPRYTTLFGPASISARYGTASQLAMMDFLRLRHGAPALSRLVTGRNPPRYRGVGRQLRRELGEIRDLDELDRLVGALEPDLSGVPVLLRQYLKLGARVMGFNVDTAFSCAVDCLVVADLRRTAARVLDRYLTPEGAARFRQFHGPSPVAVAANESTALVPGSSQHTASGIKLSRGTGPRRLVRFGP